MRAIGIYRSCVLAFTLGLSTLAVGGMAGCAVQTANGDPAAETEQGSPRGEPASEPTSETGQTVETPAASADLDTSPTTGGTKSGTESSAAAVKAQATPPACVASNSCGNSGASDNTQPLPWIAR
jgi:hypothetical protein